MGSYDLEGTRTMSWFNYYPIAGTDVYQIISRKNQTNVLVKSTNAQYMILGLVDQLTGKILKSWQFSSSLSYDYFPGHRVIIDKQLNTYLIDSFDDTDIVKFTPQLGSFQYRFYDNLKTGGINIKQSSIIYDDISDNIFIASMLTQDQNFMIAQFNLNPISMSRKQFSLVTPLSINDNVFNQVLELSDTEILGCLMYNQDSGSGIMKNYIGYMRFNRATNLMTKVVREQTGTLTATTSRRCTGINKQKNGELRLFVTSFDKATQKNEIGFYIIKNDTAQHQFFKYSTFKNIDTFVIKAKYFKLKDGWFLSGQFFLSSVKSGFVETIIDEYSCFKLFSAQTLQSQQSFQDLIQYTAISTTSKTYDTQNLNQVTQQSSYAGSPYYYHMAQAIRETYPDTKYCASYAGDISIFHTPSQKVADNVTIECVLYDKAVCSQVAQYKISECYDQLPMYFELRDYANNTNVYTTKKLLVPTYKLNISSVDFRKKVEIGKVYHVQVHAYIQRSGLEYKTNDFIDFYVTFTGCDDKVQFVQNMKIKNQKYVMGFGLQTFRMQPPLYTFPDCVRGITYTFLSRGNIHNNFLDFEQSLYLFVLESRDPNLLGQKIRVYVNCKLTTLYNITNSKLSIDYSFVISFLDPLFLNQAPYFSQKLVDQTAMITTTTTYVLPPVLDKENDQYFVVAMADSKAAKFMTYYDETNNITMNPQPQDVGSYVVKLQTVQLDDFDLVNDYSFTVTVVPYSKEMAFQNQQDKTKKLAKPNLKAKISKISSTAIVTVIFEKVMDTPSSEAQLQYLNNSLAVYIKSEYLGHIKLGYELLSLKEDTLLLKLTFPFDRSMISQESQDEIEIVYVSEDTYYSKDFTHKIPLNYKISKAIIPQLSDEELDFLNQMAELMKWTLSSILGPSMVINIAMQQGLQSIWGMINGLQLLTHLPLMNLNMPANLICFYSLINDIASFDLIPTDSFTDDIMEFDEDSDYAFNNSFDFMGYQSVNLITNLGLFFYIILINLVILILALYASVLLYATKYKRSSFYKYINEKLLFNQILRLQLEAQLELCLCSLLAVFNPLFAALVVYIMKRDQKQNESLSTIYEDYNLDSPMIVIFTFLSVGRRSIYTFVMIRLQYKPSFQIIAQMYLSILMLVLIFTIKPYKCQRQQRNEIINELTFLGACYTFIPYSSVFKLDSKVKFMIGWIQIGIVLVHVAISLAFIFVNTIKNIIISIKKFKLKQRIAKFLVKLKAQIDQIQAEKLENKLFKVKKNDFFQNESFNIFNNIQTNSKSDNLKIKSNQNGNLVGKNYQANQRYTRNNEIQGNNLPSFQSLKNHGFITQLNSFNINTSADLNSFADHDQEESFCYHFDK
eukprot:403346742